MFTKTVLLERLASLGHRLQTEEGRRECPKNMISPSGFLAEVCHLFLVFSTGSQQTKMHLAHSSKSLRFILQTASSRWAAAAGSTEIVPEDEVDVDMDSVRALLNCLKNLSSEQVCLDALDAAGIIPALIPFLSIRVVPSEVFLESGVAKRLRKRRQLESILNAIPEVHDVALVTLYYVCHGSASRQERAAASGIISCAKTAITERTMVKAFALQLLVEMTQATPLTRNCLYRDNALDFFLDLLHGSGEASSTVVVVDPIWQEQALFALSQFLIPGGHSTEFERSLLRPIGIHRLLDVYINCRLESLDTIVKTLVNMLETSPRLAEGLGRCGFLVSVSLDRLQQPELPLDTKLNVAKLLDLAVRFHAEPAVVVLEHNLLAIVGGLRAKAMKKREDAPLDLVFGQLLTSWNRLVVET
ncbi:hypothetical protein BASA81_009301 [Batrachochytrium salamandrivorans]|nr:hypothetical protein BASA81_009301 [Batrachochytrium salamandrivorans]